METIDNSFRMELASDMAHIVAQETLDLSENDMWVEHKNGDLNYKEEVQDVFNGFFDQFIDILNKRLREPRVYVLNIEYITDELIPTSENFNKEKFILLSEKEGSVYSLNGFFKAFNNEEINQNVDYIIID